MATMESRAVVEPRLRPLTVADLAELPAELPSGPVLYELDNGRLITMSPPGFEHASIESNIVIALGEQGQRKGYGKVCSGEGSLVLWRNPDRVVGMDVAFIASSSLPVSLSKEGYLETMPELVVEVLSKNDTRAYIQRKVDDYLTAGVRIVWVANPQTQTLTEHRKDREAKTFAASDTVTLADLIPNFSLPVSEVFAE